MRNIPINTLVKLSKRTAVEPIFIVKIFWFDKQPDNFKLYADRNLFYGTTDIPTIFGSVISIGNIDDVINLDGASSSGTCSVTLDTTYNDIKELFNNNDIHGKKIQILQTFDGWAYEEAFIIFEGVASSPIIYDEGERTFSFNVVTVLDDVEVGFAIEDGFFKNASKDLIGVTWPMPFGYVQGIKAIPLNPLPKTLTGIDGGVNIDDRFTTAKKYQKKQDAIKTMQSQANYALYLQTIYSYLASKIELQDFYNQTKNETESNAYRQQSDQYGQQAQEYLTQLNKLTDELAQQVAEDKAQKALLEKPTYPLINGTNLPNSGLNPITIRIAGIEHKGGFEAGNFNVLKDGIVNPFPQDAYFSVLSGQIYENIESSLITKYEYLSNQNQFLYFKAGEPVTIVSGIVLKYIVSCRQTKIVQVYGFKNGIKTPISKSYYSVETIQLPYSGLVGVLLTFFKPMSGIRNGGWTDDIEVDVDTRETISDNNPITIMIDLIDKYSKYTYDEASFNEVASLVTASPCFCLTERIPLIKLLSDIAFQCNCAIYLNDNKFYIKYLPKGGTPVQTLTLADIKEKTLQITSTSTEDIYTRISASFKKKQSDTTDSKIIYRYNIPKYGLKAIDYNFYIFRDFKSVAHRLQFWVIRKSNVWKKITFSTFLTSLNIEKWDTITLNLPQGFIDKAGNVNGIVEKATYNTSTNLIDMEVWLPIRLGEMEPYKYALPHDIDATLVFAQEPDPNLGLGYDITNSSTEKLLEPKDITSPTFTIDTTKKPYGFGDPAGVGEGGSDIPDVRSIVLKDELEGKEFKQTSYEDYKIKPVENVRLPTNGVFPGLLMEKQEDGTYSAQIYVNGLKNSSQDVNVKIIAIDSASIIPPNYPVLINRQVIPNNNGTFDIEYTCQPPVWGKQV